MAVEIYKMSEKVPETGQSVWIHLKKGGEELYGEFKRFNEMHLNGAHVLVDGVRWYLFEIDTWHVEPLEDEPTPSEDDMFPTPSEGEEEAPSEETPSGDVEEEMTPSDEEGEENPTSTEDEGIPFEEDETPSEEEEPSETVSE